jgi:hypothetical protein
VASAHRLRRSEAGWTDPRLLLKKLARFSFFRGDPNPRIAAVIPLHFENHWIAV